MMLLRILKWLTTRLLRLGVGQYREQLVIRMSICSNQKVFISLGFKSRKCQVGRGQTKADGGSSPSRLREAAAGSVASSIGLSTEELSAQQWCQ